jgi:DNA-binding transcriptional LysR family regulator
VLRERGSGTRLVFEDALVASGINPDDLDVRLELPSNEAVRAAVEAGAGATVISALVVRAGLAAGSLVELPFAFPQRPFTALRHGDRHRSRAAAALLDMIRPPPG